MKELDNDLNPEWAVSHSSQNSDHSVESIATGAPLMSGHVQPLGTVVGCSAAAQSIAACPVRRSDIYFPMVEGSYTVTASSTKPSCLLEALEIAPSYH